MSQLPMTRSMLSPEQVDSFVRLGADLARRRAQVAVEAPTEAFYAERDAEAASAAPAPKVRRAPTKARRRRG